MRKGFITFLTAIAVAAWCVGASTNYVTRTASIGTHEQVIPTTSALWRAILPTETAREALWGLGITNDANGVLYTTNLYNPSTNVVGQADSTAIRDGYFFAPATGSTGATNYFWMDFGRTNAFGQHLIYASAIATNDIVMLGPTNASQWGLLSFNIVASGGNRIVYLPPGIFGLNTNGLNFTNGWAYAVVSNGYYWRSTTQTNAVYETLWRVN